MTADRDIVALQLAADALDQFASSRGLMEETLRLSEVAGALHGAAFHALAGATHDEIRLMAWAASEAASAELTRLVRQVADQSADLVRRFATATSRAA